MTNATKLALEESLKHLLLKKPLDKITINDLTTDCGISRMTFYYHFKDIYDLVEWCCLEDARIALQGKKTSSTWHEGLLQIFDAVMENKPFILNVYRCVGPDRETSYDKLDYMNMSIAAKADGIILQYNGEAGLEEAINTAVRNGIPVVTVMSDAVHSRRQSFVGVSDYQLGMAYGEIVAKYVDENTKKILILQKRDIDDMNESQIYTQISNAVKMAAGSEDIEIKGRNLLSTGTFETEEAVTDIFQQKRNVPDILVCMDEETTECARQAILDFNLAGKVKIIGYYTSEDILAAVEKGVISVTCDVDTTQLGQYSVEAKDPLE